MKTLFNCLTLLFAFVLANICSPQNLLKPEFAKPCGLMELMENYAAFNGIKIYYEADREG